VGETGVDAAEGVDHLEHDRRGVAGLAGGRVLDLALELGLQQVGEGRGRCLELGGVVDEVSLQRCAVGRRRRPASPPLAADVGSSRALLALLS
jgi:hypothetical protein